MCVIVIIKDKIMKKVVRFKFAELSMFLLLLRNVSSVVKVVVGAAISIEVRMEGIQTGIQEDRSRMKLEEEKVSSLVPSHLILNFSFLHIYYTCIEATYRPI